MFTRDIVPDLNLDPFEATGAFVAILTSTAVISYAFVGTTIPVRVYMNLILGGCLVVYYLSRATAPIRLKFEDDGSITRTVYDSWRERFTHVWYIVAGSLGATASVYVHINFERWVSEGQLFIFNNTDILIGVILIVLVIDITYRSFGALLAGTVVVSLLYGHFGNQAPGLLQHSGLSIDRLIARNTIAFDGLYGSLLELGVTWVAIFLIFAGFIESNDGFDYVKQMSRQIARFSRSGVAQGALVSSMVIGMVMGGSATNVATTGSFTIPMMKSNNIPGRFAAAAESMASTGGQILPPVMGLAAFLMANFVGMPYREIIVAALIPALLFYVILALGIHLAVLKNGWSVKLENVTKTAEEDKMSIWGGLQYGIPLVGLIYGLMVMNLPIMLAGGYTILIFLVFRSIYLMIDGRLLDIISGIIMGLWDGAEKLAPFVGLLAALGIVVNVLSFSGLGQRISITLLTVSGGSLLITLFIVAFVSILFGLGLPTPAAYIVVATIVAPALIRLGVQPLVAHMYVFYFAMLSSITPPIAVAVAVACRIADVEFFEAAKATLTLGGPVYFIPFLFVFYPSLLTWSVPNVIIAALVAMVSLIALTVAFTGYSGRSVLRSYLRASIVFFVTGIIFGPVMFL
ncbi:TRAP transporter fused permease subunit [Halobellus sp. GM3]|uniref:TRAP transporter fused permease subunit n=1 Tax=Halobellus sp. GM3 TaxID=3458410 RepID=UPI00403E0BCE